MLSRHDLTRRIAVSAIVICLVICLVLFAYQPILRYGVVALVALLSGVAIWEYDQFAKAKGGQMIFPALLTLTACEVLSFYAMICPCCKGLPLLVFFVGFLVLFALHFRQKDGAIVDLAVSTFGLIYIAVPFGMLLGILYLTPLSVGQDGRWWLSFLLVVTKITDIGAYFGGNLWGRRKLAPTISPKKTVEGAFFGLACAVGASFVLYKLCPGHLTTGEWVILGLLLGTVGQFGDLSESLLKRDANKKDSNALPGLGGVLDSVDSLLFNAPILYIYLQYVK
ncbi:MAG TPA: phosphatidate cytidylyltransferase [Chlamydiales bacterium]